MLLQCESNKYCVFWVSVCVCVCVALVIHHTMRMLHIVCDLIGSTIFFHIICETSQFSKKKNFTEDKMCVLIFSATFAWNKSHTKNNWARYDQKCLLFFMWKSRYSFPILTELEFFDKFPKKNSLNVKFHENPSNEKLFVPCGQTDRQKWRS